MKFDPVRKMAVVLDLEGKARSLGTLAWSSDVRATVDRWPDFADQAELSSSRTTELGRILNGR